MSGGFPILPDLCAGSDQGTDTANTRGTAFTCGNSVYGSYVQLVASTARDTEWIFLQTQTDGTANIGTTCKVKLAVGGAGSEVTVILDLVLSDGSGGVLHTGAVLCPLSIPAGSRIAIAGYETGHTDVFYASLTLWDAGFAGQGIAGYDAIGISGDHGTSVTTGAANTKGSYAQLIASTSADYCGVFFSMDPMDSTLSATRWLIDIAIGGAGSEQIIIPNFYLDSNNSPRIPISSFFPLSIPAGTRIAARAQSLAGSTSVGIAVYGAYQ